MSVSKIKGVVAVGLAAVALTMLPLSAWADQPADKRPGYAPRSATSIRASAAITPDSATT